MAALTPNTSAIAFAGFALASFLSLSVWVFPPQQTQSHRPAESIPLQDVIRGLTGDLTGNTTA
jgi:hypothetical protein